MRPLTSVEKDNLAKALLEVQRREMLELLLKERKPLSQDYIRKSLGHPTQAMTSRHQNYLKNMGFIVVQKQPQGVAVHLNNEYRPHIRHVLEVLGSTDLPQHAASGSVPVAV